ncbi:13438_t:CDS:2 [Cetraspora pellucida]|uniref:13438_t:CDS:1 n=1 Tax=Cetraspora pellucida TaxID=1433469 RepID=A0A9N9EN76_9GLOM|nr:13438_t:CDS:2 [Cetraspora pellucida]
MIQQPENEIITLDSEEWLNNIKDCSKFLNKNNSKNFQFNFKKLENIGSTSSTYDFNLLKAIIHGKREVAIFGTPIKYMKIYTECWQHHSDKRPTIQHVVEDLNRINYDNLESEEIIAESNKKIRQENTTLEVENSNITGISQHYVTHDEIANELKLLSSIVTILNKTLSENILFEDQSNLDDDQNDIIPENKISEQSDVDSELKFLYDLNQIFITQVNIQGASKYTSSSIVYHINKFIGDNYQVQSKVFYQYYNHRYRSCFTSIIGFFYEHGIGTVVDCNKAFDMYKQAADESHFTPNDSLNGLDNSLITDNLLKDNRLIGLISLGLFYLHGKGVSVNQQKALQLFLQSVSIGSSLGKCYVADCYYNGYGVIEDKSQSFEWSLKSAEEGNARAQNIIGHSYISDSGIPKDNDKIVSHTNFEHIYLENYNNDCDPAHFIENKLTDSTIHRQIKHTVFIAWTGSMTQDELKALFNSDDVEEIRFLPNKQFAHVDFKTEAALRKALNLNGEVKSQEQGILRVELGRPRGYKIYD